MRFIADFKDLLRLADHIHDVAIKFPQSFSGVLNRIGNRTYSRVAAAMSESIGAPVRGDDVKDALKATEASFLAPEYLIETQTERFKYVKWITAADDKVCPICAPLHNQIMLESAALTLEIHGGPIGHNNCRCHLEAVDLAGSMLGVAPAIVTPAAEEISRELGEKYMALWGSE